VDRLGGPCRFLAVANDARHAAARYRRLPLPDAVPVRAGRRKVPLLMWITDEQNAQYEREMGTLREALDRGETEAQYVERCAKAWNALREPQEFVLSHQGPEPGDGE
jgi:hypothetical protein